MRVIDLPLGIFPFCSTYYLIACALSDSDRWYKLTCLCSTLTSCGEGSDEQEALTN